MDKQALLIIDYTNDFVADNGALTCGQPAQALADTIVALADQALAKGQWVILPTDVHQPNDPYHSESKLFPAHNERGSWGRAFYGPLADWYQAHRDDSHVLLLDKTRYSAFCGTRLTLFLKERGIDHLALCGVCTDICVLHTAIDAYNQGYQLTVYKDAVAALSETGQQWALNHFQNVLGAEVIEGVA